MSKRVIIIGSGFGGLDSALRLRQLNKNIEIIVIDKKPFFTYTVSLHKIISKKSNEKELTFNLSKIYKKHNIKFFNEEVINIKPNEKYVNTKSRKLKFDYLLLAFGSQTNYFGISGMEEYSLSLKKVFDAVKIRDRIKEEVEKSEFYNEPVNIMICGAGALGVEVAGEVADLVKKKAKVVISNSGDQILRGFDQKTIKYGAKVLKKKGVEIMTGKTIKKASSEKVILKDDTDIYSRLTIWCGGVKPSSLTHKTGLRTNDKGAIMINEYLQTANKNIYAIGDCSYLYKDPQPMMALTAIQQAKTVAYNINASINEKESVRYEAEKKAYLISFGKGKAVMINNNKVKTGIIPYLIKTFIEKHYIFTRKHWYWPFNRLDL